MILEITVNTSADPGWFESFGVPNQAIYAEVAGVSVCEHGKKYTLQSCPIVCDEYDNPPVWAELKAWDDSFYLHLKYKKLDERELVSVGFRVAAKTVQGFPKLG